LKDNFNVAYRRLQNLLRSLQGDKEKYSMYNETFISYLREGIIEEAKDNSNRVAKFYLPHRHVWTPSKSTQLRVVFDASSHAKDELSLNDFRTHLYTMVADIQKAFLQIRLPESHRDVTRFLWVDDASQPATGSNLKHYRFCRVPFGINASPAILNQCILKYIEGSQSEISQELSNSLYVDNVFLEGKSPDDLLHKYTESKRLFSSIGMNLRDYLSNSAHVNIGIPALDRASSTEIKVLGMLWNAMEDTISLKCGEKQANKISKRTILSQINGCCFDPLGLLTPLEEDELSWKAIKSKIIGFQVTLPRKVVQNNNSTSHTLSVFVDSSKRAYACSIYVTTTSYHGVEESRLFTAKSEIAPINKEQTIPRLELLSIFIGLGLVESTIQKINVKFEKISIFSDSTIALCWIQGNRRLPPIASNIAEIATDPIWPTDRVSNYTKLLRIVAYSARFIRKTSKDKYLPLKGEQLQTVTPSTREVMDAEILVIREQQAIFKSQLLMQNKQLNVKTDINGLYRRFGRLQNADLDFSAVNPVHIPKQSKLGVLIASHLHNAFVHCGINQLLYNIRRRFWISSDRALCKRTLKHC
uniref:Reverse transcriptase domain-containing protein n=1 Tax=Heligmosomoides polygyrus TaxID=6339 RepID=A0A183GRU9_HELPZ